jgi:hypothetical protein
MGDKVVALVHEGERGEEYMGVVSLPGEMTPDEIPSLFQQWRRDHQGEGDFQGWLCEFHGCVGVDCEVARLSELDAVADDETDEVPFLNLGVLEKLTGKKWKEAEGPKTGIGIDWYFETVDERLAAWVNIDQIWVTIKIVSLVADENDRHEGVMPCGRYVFSQIDHYSPNLVFEIQGDVTEIPWLR